MTKLKYIKLTKTNSQEWPNSQNESIHDPSVMKQLFRNERKLKYLMKDMFQVYLVSSIGSTRAWLRGVQITGIK